MRLRVGCCAGCIPTSCRIPGKVHHRFCAPAGCRRPFEANPAHKGDHRPHAAAIGRTGACVSPSDWPNIPKENGDTLSMRHVRYVSGNPQQVPTTKRQPTRHGARRSPSDRQRCPPAINMAFKGRSQPDAKAPHRQCSARILKKVATAPLDVRITFNQRLNRYPSTLLN